MEAVYGWVKNIIYYMIFLAVVNNLLADSKYEKYVRFFAGMVLILLVVSPLTGKMRLDQQISSMFQSISLYNDASDLKSELWGMDDRRLDQIMGKYQEAVEQDVAAMAEASGLTCVDASVRIDGDRNSSTYGQVTDIRMEVRDNGENVDGGEYAGTKPVNVDAGKVDSIMVEQVELGGGKRNGAGEIQAGAGEMQAGAGEIQAGAGEIQAGGTQAGEMQAGTREPQTGGPQPGLGEPQTGGPQPGPGEPQAETGPAGADSTASGKSSTVSGGSDKIMNHLTGKVAQYYGIEESHIEVQWKDD